MRALHLYFCARKALTLALLWVFFAIALGYMLLCLSVCPNLPYWLCLVPGLICLYFRLLYSHQANRKQF